MNRLPITTPPIAVSVSAEFGTGLFGTGEFGTGLFGTGEFGTGAASWSVIWPTVTLPRFPRMRVVEQPGDVEAEDRRLRDVDAGAARRRDRRAPGFWVYGGMNWSFVPPKRIDSSRTPRSSESASCSWPSFSWLNRVSAAWS